MYLFTSPNGENLSKNFCFFETFLLTYYFSATVYLIDAKEILYSRLLLIKVKLEEIWLGGDQALVTCKRLLQTWKTLYDMELERFEKKSYSRKNFKRLPTHDITWRLKN